MSYARRHVPAQGGSLWAGEVSDRHGGAMSNKSFLPLLVAAFLGSVLPAHSQGRGGPAPALPDGPGKDAVQTTCTKCHAATLIINSGGYTQAGWEEAFGTMVALPKDKATEISGYLAKNFPEKPRPPAVVIPGPTTVSFKEWTPPTLGQRPHDPHTPLFDQKGILWYTMQGANMVGRLDPKTGAMKVVTVQTPKSNPYGMVVTTKGVPFFCEFGANKMASIDPATMAIKEYDL